MTAGAGMDYLHALAARSLGVSDSVRPRLPSLFEPVTGATPLDVEAARAAPPARAVEADTGRSTDGRDAVPGDHAPRESHSAAREPVPSSQLPAEPTARAPRQTVAAPARAAPAPPERHSHGGGHSGDPAPALRELSTGAVAPHHSNETGNPGGRWSRPDTSPQPDTLPVPARGQPLQGPDDQPAPQRPNTFSTAAAAPLTPLLLRPRPIEPVRTILSRLAPLAAAPTPSQKETVVQVTIGRIEVKAVPAPAPAARKPPAAPPVMSLDDYLRRRSGGGG